MLCLTLTEKFKAKTEPWFSRLLRYPAMQETQQAYYWIHTQCLELLARIHTGKPGTSRKTWLNNITDWKKINLEGLRNRTTDMNGEIYC